MKGRLLSDADLRAVDDEYVLARHGVGAPDARLVALRLEHVRLRQVLYSARRLVKLVEDGDETCVCGFAKGHGRGCPVRQLARLVAKAGEP